MSDKAEVVWVALECQVRQESSDEVYGTLNMVPVDGRDAISHKFPGDRDAWDMGEDGQRIVALSVPMYMGSPKGLAITASLVEHDSGNIDEYKARAAKALGAAANSAAAAFTVGLSAVAATVINDLATALVNAAADVLGADDDAYNPQTLRLNQGDFVGPPVSEPDSVQGRRPENGQLHAQARAQRHRPRRRSRRVRVLLRRSSR